MESEQEQASDEGGRSRLTWEEASALFEGVARRNRENRPGPKCANCRRGPHTGTWTGGSVHRFFEGPDGERLCKRCYRERLRERDGDE